MSVIDKAIRYARQVVWAYEMRKIDRRLERQFPKMAERRKALEKARRSHKRCAHIFKAQQADMTAALRGD